MICAEDIGLANNYAQNFISFSESLPHQIQIYLTDIAELDIQINKLNEKLNEYENSYEENYEVLEKILDGIQVFSIEKLKISSNISEIIENSLKILDNDKKAIEKNDILKNIFFNITSDVAKQTHKYTKKTCLSPFSTNISASNTPRYSINSPMTEGDDIINSPYYSPSNIMHLTTISEGHGSMSNFYSDPDLFSAKHFPSITDNTDDNQYELNNRSKRNRRLKGCLNKDHIDSNYIYGDPKFNFKNDIIPDVRKKKHKHKNDNEMTPLRPNEEVEDPDLKPVPLKVRKGRPALSTSVTVSSQKRFEKILANSVLARKKQQNKLLYKYLGRNKILFSKNVVKNFGKNNNLNTTTYLNKPSTSSSFYKGRLPQNYRNADETDSKLNKFEEHTNYHCKEDSEDRSEKSFNLSDVNSLEENAHSIVNRVAIPQQDNTIIMESTSKSNDPKQRLCLTSTNGSSNKRKLIAAVTKTTSNLQQSKNFSFGGEKGSNSNNTYSSNRPTTNFARKSRFRRARRRNGRSHNNSDSDDAGTCKIKSQVRTASDHEDETENDDPDEDDQEEYYFLDKLVDPDEPTYCLCDRISYGEMIGCDNPRCSIEWYHFDCVNLTHKPKGKWYCPKCRKDNVGKVCKFNL